MDIYPRMWAVNLGITAAVVIINILWIPFDKGHRMLRLGRAAGFFSAVFLMGMASSESWTYGEPTYVLVVEMFFILGLAGLFTFVKSPTVESST